MISYLTPIIGTPIPQSDSALRQIVFFDSGLVLFDPQHFSLCSLPQNREYVSGLGIYNGVLLFQAPKIQGGTYAKCYYSVEFASGTLAITDLKTLRGLFSYEDRELPAFLQSISNEGCTATESKLQNLETLIRDRPIRLHNAMHVFEFHKVVQIRQIQGIVGNPVFIGDGFAIISGGVAGGDRILGNANRSTVPTANEVALIAQWWDGNDEHVTFDDRQSDSSNL